MSRTFLAAIALRSVASCEASRYSCGPGRNSGELSDAYSSACFAFR